MSVLPLYKLTYNVSSIARLSNVLGPNGQHLIYQRKHMRTTR